MVHSFLSIVTTLDRWFGDRSICTDVVFKGGTAAHLSDEPLVASYDTHRQIWGDVILLCRHHTARKQIANAMRSKDQINCQARTQELVKKLMDTVRLLRDIQHAKSATRRNFALFSLKKEVKEHLSDSKIDKYLFDVNIAETLTILCGQLVQLRQSRPEACIKVQIASVSQAPSASSQAGRRREPLPERRTTSRLGSLRRPALAPSRTVDAYYP